MSKNPRFVSLKAYRTPVDGKKGGRPKKTAVITPCASPSEDFQAEWIEFIPNEFQGLFAAANGDGRTTLTWQYCGETHELEIGNLTRRSKKGEERRLTLDGLFSALDLADKRRTDFEGFNGQVVSVSGPDIPEHAIATFLRGMPLFRQSIFESRAVRLDDLVRACAYDSRSREYYRAIVSLLLLSVVEMSVRSNASADAETLLRPRPLLRIAQVSDGASLSLEQVKELLSQTENRKSRDAVMSALAGFEVNLFDTAIGIIVSDSQRSRQIGEEGDGRLGKRFFKCPKPGYNSALSLAEIRLYGVISSYAPCQANSNFSRTFSLDSLAQLAGRCGELTAHKGRFLGALSLVAEHFGTLIVDSDRVGVWFGVYGEHAKNIETSAVKGKLQITSPREGQIGENPPPVKAKLEKTPPPREGQIGENPPLVKAKLEKTPLAMHCNHSADGGLSRSSLETIRQGGFKLEGSAARLAGSLNTEKTVRSLPPVGTSDSSPTGDSNKTKTRTKAFTPTTEEVLRYLETLATPSEKALYNNIGHDFFVKTCLRRMKEIWSEN